MQKVNIKSLQKYVVFFYVYAFLGWIVDVTICLVSDGVLENRGFLYETICPMYGLAAIVLIILSKRINGRGGLIKSFIIATLWCSALEYLTSLILEVFFKIRWWDYSREPYNIEGRICLAASIFWGILSLLFMREIHPFVERQLRKIASKMKLRTRSIIVYTALTITSIDLIISIVNYLVH